MKKNALTAILVAALLLTAGCGKNDAEHGSGVNSEPIAVSDVSEEESSGEAQSEAAQSEQQEESTEESIPMEESFDVYVPNPDNVVTESDARLSTDKTEYKSGENVTVHFSGTDAKDWIGFYNETEGPGTVPAIVWKYSVGEGDLIFTVNSIGKAGRYTAFLCDNDGYVVLAETTITIIDEDTNDYGAKSVTLDVAFDDNGISHAVATVTPGSEVKAEYRLYWSKNGNPLEGYEPIFKTEHSGTDPFDMELNAGLFMPDDADGVCVVVRKGSSTVCSTSAPDSMKLKQSKHLYDFAVITDLHINKDRSEFTSHLKAAMGNIKTLYPDCTAIFTVGDNTDNGYAEQYELLMDTIAACKPTAPLYFTLGNHDLMYGTDYNEQVERFRYYTGMRTPYYSVTLEDTKFIVLASDSLDGNGTMGKTERDWLRAELEKCGKNDRIFLFVHQPLIETVSGSLYSRDNEIQDWYGFYDSGNIIHDMLREYPNATLFTGHTHWTLESYQPVLIGNGRDASFVNCASVGYLWTDEDKSTGGSEGIFVEVYEDYILIRGREYRNNTWCAATQICIPRF